VRRLTAPLLVFAYGNPSRGDDALGPQLLELLAESRVQHPEWLEFELVTDFQLQVEHAMDLEGRELSCSSTPAYPARPHSFFPAFSRRRMPATTTHEMSPQAVLHVFEQVANGPPPRPSCWLCEGKASIWANR